MQYRGRITEEILFETAESIGLNINKLKEDLDSNDIKLIIERNKDLAKRLNINGTPSFVIGKKIIPGAVNEEQLIKLIEEERKSNS
jgi:predicted DsbA family dithiol-disulfide isomerase